MNDRIKELARQAGQTETFKINGEPILHYYVSGHGFVRVDNFTEKFAELIVKECVQALWTEECNYSDLAIEDFNKNQRKILGHFGVEE